MKSKREIFHKVNENKQLRGVVPVYDAQGTVKFDDEIAEKRRFETKTDEARPCRYRVVEELFSTRKAQPEHG